MRRFLFYQKSSGAGLRCKDTRRAEVAGGWPSEKQSEHGCIVAYCGACLCMGCLRFSFLLPASGSQIKPLGPSRSRRASGIMYVALKGVCRFGRDVALAGVWRFGRDIAVAKLSLGNLSCVGKDRSRMQRSGRILNRRTNEYMIL